MLERYINLTPEMINTINNMAYNTWALAQTYTQICALTPEETNSEVEKLIVSVLPSVKCN